MKKGNHDIKYAEKKWVELASNYCDPLTFLEMVCLCVCDIAYVISNNEYK